MPSSWFAAIILCCCVATTCVMGSCVVVASRRVKVSSSRHSVAVVVAAVSSCFGCLPSSLGHVVGICPIPQSPCHVRNVHVHGMSDVPCCSCTQCISEGGRRRRGSGHTHRWVCVQFPSAHAMYVTWVRPSFVDLGAWCLVSIVRVVLRQCG
jgi:hypothetical protein